jgi:hypothetical protein
MKLETIAERRERMLAEHARANAARLRAEHWARKDQLGGGDQGLPREPGQ